MLSRWLEGTQEIGALIPLWDAATQLLQQPPPKNVIVSSFEKNKKEIQRETEEVEQEGDRRGRERREGRGMQIL